MTLDELREQCWQALPPVRKRVVGREIVNDLVTLSVENWQSEYLNACHTNHEMGVYAAALRGNVKRGHQVTSGLEPQEYGFLWALLLQAVATAVIQWLIKWWLERSSNRVLMAGWQQELTR